MIPTTTDRVETQGLIAALLRVMSLWMLVHGVHELTVVMTWASGAPSWYLVVLTLRTIIEPVAGGLILYYAAPLSRWCSNNPGSACCPNCGYDLSRITSPRCPECGLPLTPEFMPPAPITTPPAPPGPAGARYASAAPDADASAHDPDRA